jgi:hypothetical protein
MTMDESPTFSVAATTVSQAPPDRHGTDLGPDLRWLTSVLWPQADVRLAPRRVPRGCRVAEACMVVPNARRPNLVVPFASPSAARRAISEHDDALPTFARARRSVASRLEPSRYPPLVVSLAREPRPDELLTYRLRSIFDRPDATLAYAWHGQGRDRIPIVYVLTLEGELLGVAKIGWSGPTRELVGNEAVTLRRWERHPPVGFAVPALLHEGRWGEHALTVLSPAPRATRGSGSAGRSALLRSLHEIARSGGTALMELASAPWWRSALDRAAGDRALTVILGWMRDLHGRRLMWHGSCHGDLRSQHLSTTGDRLYVTGWERARDGAPLGLDPISFAIHGRNRRRDGGAFPSRAVLEDAAPALRRFGIPREDEELLLACYLAERLVREREETFGSTAPGYQTGLEDLRRWVGRA